MADKLEDLLKLNAESLALCFTVETYEETKMVMESYKMALNGEKIKNPFDRITRGHFYRGVE